MLHGPPTDTQHLENIDEFVRQIELLKTLMLRPTRRELMNSRIEMPTASWGQVEQTVVRLAHAIAAERGEQFLRLFDDSLHADVARLEVRRRVRREMPTVQSQVLELAIEECLSP